MRIPYLETPFEIIKTKLHTNFSGTLAKHKVTKKVKRTLFSNALCVLALFHAVPAFCQSQILTVSSLDSIPVFSQPLIAGATYRITASGTWSAWSEYIDSGVDACYLYDTPPGYQGAGTALIYPVTGVLQINSAPFSTPPPPYTLSHVYSIYYNGTGAAVAFRIWDPYYPGNSGNLTVKIEQVLPTISYLIPDIGTLGMNTCVEIIGPHASDGNFGTDGMYLNNPGDLVQVACANMSDTQYVRFGPCIVSWDGKMISTQAFVLPWVQATTSDWQNGIKIPLQVIVNGIASNADTFYIVKPQTIGTINTPGVIGSGGPYGVRSRRGAMIVDSMILTGNGTYTVSTTDCDASTPGNQGFLPFVLLSKGNVSISASTTLSVSANDSTGGPGGGGGGNGMICNNSAGDGYTVGGINNDLWDPNAPCITQPPNPIGSGDSTVSLNGASGGGSNITNEGGGGGTGHPFGRGGSQGGSSWTGLGSFFPSPGFGGGGGGPNFWGNFELGNHGGGGGGAFAIKGGEGGSYTMTKGFLEAAGSVVGNIENVPFAGGSGGGGGNVDADGSTVPSYWHTGAGNGGGGGGCIALFGTQSSIKGQIVSVGGVGMKSVNNGAGGGGSGGALIVGDKLPANISSVDVRGGLGGIGWPADSGQDGGAGSPGRIRLDGITAPSQAVITSQASIYSGPTTDTSASIVRSFMLTGTGNGQPVNIYIRPLSGAWYQYATIINYNTPSWSAPIFLNAPDSVYLLAVAQEVPNPDTAQYTMEPSYVLSQAGANILTVENCVSVEVFPQSDSAGDTVILNVQLGGVTAPNSTTRLHAFLHFNTDLLSPVSIIPEDCNNFIDSVRMGSITSGGVDFYVYFSNADTLPLGTSCASFNLITQAMLTDSTSTSVSVDSILFDGNKGASPLSICSGSQFSLIPQCGDSLLIKLMSGQPILISSITPNPAQDEVNVAIRRAGDFPVNYEVEDILGRIVLKGVTTSDNFTCQVDQLPEGPAYLRLESNGFVRTSRFMVMKR